MILSIFFFCSWQTKNGPHMKKGEKPEETQDICIVFSPNINLWNNEFGQKKFCPASAVIGCINHNRYYLSLQIMISWEIYSSVPSFHHSFSQCRKKEWDEMSWFVKTWCSYKSYLIQVVPLKYEKKNSNLMFAIANVILIPNPDRDKCVWVSCFLSLCIRSRFLISYFSFLLS